MALHAWRMRIFGRRKFLCHYADRNFFAANSFALRNIVRLYRLLR